MQVYDKLDSWGRTLIYDFDRYFNMCDFSPARELILTRHIDKMPYSEIILELQQKFGLKYNESHLYTILSREIPNKMALTAQKHNLLINTPLEERKKCHTCGRLLPRHTAFFAINNGRKDHFSSNCKECERLKRIEKGGQSSYDRRNKDTSLLKVPADPTT